MGNFRLGSESWSRDGDGLRHHQSQALNADLPPSRHTKPMHEITALTAADYLREMGQVPDRAEIHVRELGGGVSNIVLRADIAGRPPFVIKQCRERLRVAMDWRARLDRIWTERATLDLLGSLLPAGTVPTVLFEDRAEYLFAMTCAPDDAATWKTLLMAGQIEPTIAARLGTILGTIHAEAHGHPAMQTLLSDTSLFEELRVDPYYRTAASAHPDMAERINALIASMDRPAGLRTLVLGDFSPKNILVHSQGLILLDFECAHAGDAAFDLGFFLSHLLLKAIRAAADDKPLASRYAGLAPPFWTAYLDRRGLDAIGRSELVRRAILHVAACALARVDGKSPVEYLEGREQAVARSFARQALLTEPPSWDDLCVVLDNAIDGGLEWRS
jgi:5-methylthioribose kinase